MRLALTAVLSRRGRLADVVVEADPAAPVGDLAAELAGLLRASPATQTGAVQAGTVRSGQPVGPSQLSTPLYLDGHLIEPSLSIADSPLRPGCVVSLGDASGCMPEESRGVVEIRVAGGPAAGAIHRLAPGSADIGSGDQALVWVPDPSVAGQALQVTVSRSGECQVSPIGEAAAFVEGEPLTAGAPWLPGQQLTVGGSLLELARSEPADAALHPSADGSGLDFNRPPRLLPPAGQSKFRIPDAPAKDQSRLLAMLAGAAVMVAGPIVGGLSGHWTLLAMSALGPVAMIAPNVINRRQGVKSFARRQAQYLEQKERIENNAHEALAAERDLRRASAPDPATVLAIATGPRRRLWERRRSDPDYLVLRVGTADLPSLVELNDPNDAHGAAAVLPIPDCPVTILLRDSGVLGVAGPRGTPQHLGSWLVGQAAALHSPNDLQVCLLTDPSADDAEATWEWIRWLPHCRRPGASAATLIGNDYASRRERIRELQELIDDRRKLRADRSAEPVTPDILLVLDGAGRLLRSVPGVRAILRDGPNAGIYAVCLDSEERLLPGECTAVAVVEGDGLRVGQTGVAEIRGVRPEFVRPSWGMRLARGIAPIRDITHEEGRVRLPASSRLLEVLGLDPPTPGQIASRWKAGGSSTRAVVGEGVDGPFALDLHYLRDGPHGLIAGMPGSGKSELLQTIVAALAVANRPDAMTFVLVDYKGGAAFKDCKDLPHTVGMVMDLDGHLVGRALASLNAELERRKRMLAPVHANDIEEYTELRARALRERALRGGGEISENLREPMPRLLIVIDEFAAMVRDLPDFVPGLVSIAQLGRSLGLHLILATQRPAGVVNADFLATMNLKIALRVTEQSESVDVIEAPDAAHIPRGLPGRAYARFGHAALAPFQAGYLGGTRPQADAPGRSRVWAAPVRWAELGRAEPQPPKAAKKREGEEITDLRALVDAIKLTAEGLGIPSQPSPWLPPLPDLVMLGELPPLATAASDAPPVPFGLTDIPAGQTREPMDLDLAAGGHVVVAGGAHSGRSTVLRTIAGSVAVHASPADVHIYALDCGAGALLPLASLPHCGAVVTRGETDRVERLLRSLQKEVARRQKLLAAGEFSGIAEQRARTSDPSQRLPWMVLLLDWWEGFHAAYEKVDFGGLIDSFLQLLSEGAGVGMSAVVTTDRLALTGRTGTAFERSMLLRLTDRGDSTLAGISERSLPSHQPPGRIIFEGETEPLEVQVALLDADPSGPAQADALRRLGEAALARYGRPDGRLRPLRVDPLPFSITQEQAWRQDPGFTPPSPLWALVGVGGDELGPVGLDLATEGPGVTIAGPPHSGRSATLLTMATSLLARGTPVLVLTPRRSPLRSLDGRTGVIAVLGPDATPDEVTAATSDREGYAVVVDDAELLSNGPLSAPLEKILVSGRDGEHGLIIAGATDDLGRAFGGFIREALKSRCGVLVAVHAHTDGDLFGARLPRNATAGALGRGLLVRPGTVMPVQLAITE